MSAFPTLSALVLFSGCLPQWAPLGEDDLDGDGYTSQIDSDGDGFASTDSGGDDCDDTTATIHPGAAEIGWNEIDEDCSGRDLHDYTQISAGNYHVCGVTSDDKVVCWGNPEIEEPAAHSLGNHDSVACGINTTCTVTLENNLDCYGDFNPQYTDLPGETGFIGVALPVQHNFPVCGLKEDSTLACGHCPSDDHPACVPPGGEFEEIDLASGRGCALSESGGVSCWGSEASPNDPLESSAPEDAGYHNIQLSSDQDACVLTTEGALHCWGSSWTDFGPATQAGSEGPFTQMSAYSGALCAIGDENSSLWCYGIDEENVPTGTFTEVSLGYHFSCALDTLGEAHCWQLYAEHSLGHDSVLDPP